MTGDDLGTRMKEYERTAQHNLLRRTPVLIRIDGRAFHTFTKTFKSLCPSLEKTPFSVLLHEIMVSTTETLVGNVQGCVLGYTQSDEISLLVRDWDSITTDSWFGNNIQKVVSLSAAIASNAFNHNYSKYKILENVNQYAQFDSRAFNLPKEEVTNYFIWRQQDAMRNSIQMLGHYHFSVREMHRLNNSAVRSKLVEEKNVVWDELPPWMQRGTCVMRVPRGGKENIVVTPQTEREAQLGAMVVKSIVGQPTNTTGKRINIVVDENIPIFTEDRKFIEDFLQISEV